MVILVLSPVIALSAMHDRLMFKFLNRTYIYNVSWEVSTDLLVGREIRMQ